MGVASLPRERPRETAHSLHPPPAMNQHSSVIPWMVTTIFRA